MQALSTHFIGATVAVMGLGKSGAASARALLAAGARVLAWDDQEETRAMAEEQGLPLADLSAADWKAIDLLVWSPGIPHTHPTPHPVAEAARAAGVKLVCDIDLLCAANPGARTVAITGTNGKSTTTTLTGHLLAGLGTPLAVGGNLGVPALDLPSLGLDGTYVLELSSYQLELLDQAQFDIAVLLNITPDHLARHGGMEGYVAAKASMFDRLPAGSTAVVAVDDIHSAEIHLRLTRRKDIVTRAISAQKVVEGGVYAPEGILIDDLDGKAVPILDLSDVAALPGRHNWQNACAAYVIGRACGMTPHAIAERLRSYPGLKHRQELVAIIDGVRYVNDSKATNADAAEKAMVCYDRIYWIAGGQAKEGGIESLRPLFPRIARAFLIGEAAQSFADTLSGTVGYEMCGTLDIAIHRARDLALADPDPASGVVLLSPACASWDQFKSFEHRGDAFRDIVNGLSGERSAA
ncbi:MAG TPA: UDP-N-acetylmuramoyl-L-alanine--D-glutamate ligase [Magnetospirillaceae bacterium]|nr:UDP-N-acetylmuramoyl-L-alanine--D-glutamate ligase [Magnetospirillaceae bacterium]